MPEPRRPSRVVPEVARMDVGMPMTVTVKGTGIPPGTEAIRFAVPAPAALVRVTVALPFTLGVEVTGLLMRPLPSVSFTVTDSPSSGAPVQSTTENVTVVEVPVDAPAAEIRSGVLLFQDSVGVGASISSEGTTGIAAFVPT